MKINFLGAAQTVTGSQFLLEINGSKLLLECGLYQGQRAEAFQRNRTFHFDPKQIDAVILSHAHIDHSGNLPSLVKNGYHGPIYTTPASAHLANIMLMDSGHIQEMDVKFVNKRRVRRGEAALEPLYTIEDAALVAQHFQTRRYDEKFEVMPGVQAQLVDAGHILGSASVVLDIDEGGRQYRFWFSGDIGRPRLPLLRDPTPPVDADFLMMECTYGDKAHKRSPEEAYDELREVVKQTLERGGKVIIPAFAVGRTQELVYDFHQMIDKGEIPSVPVVVDSPLAINASEVFEAHPECFDAETRQFIREGGHRSVFGFDRLVYTRSVEESKALNFNKEPMIILSASGMAETGRILHHLRNNIENARNTILIVSWQAPYTLGRRLAERKREVKIFGEVYQRRAEVATIGGLSAHAGQKYLLEYAGALKGRAQKVILVHGEEPAAAELQAKLAEIGMNDVIYPAANTSLCL